MAHRLDDLLAPLGLERFRTDHDGRAPVHLSAGAGAPRWLDWPALAELLNMTALWSAETLSLLEAGQPVAAARYCEPATDRDLQPVQRPLAARVRALQADGAVLVARRIETLSPVLKAVAVDLEAAFAARATADLQVHRRPAPAPAGTCALADLWLLGLAGTTRVRVASATQEHPVPHPKFAATAPLPDPAALRLEARLAAGDRLYVPRGCVYALDVLSPDTALVSFTVTRPVGLDLLQALADAALDDGFFRATLPDGDQAARDAYLAAFVRRLGELAAGPAGHDALARVARGLPRDLVDYALPADGPAAAATPRYRRSASGLTVVKTPHGWQLRGARGAVPIPTGREHLVAWVVERADFTRAELDGAFPGTAAALIDALLDELAAMKVITAVA
jgi:hypothetical protein